MKAWLNDEYVWVLSAVICFAATVFFIGNVWLAGGAFLLCIFCLWRAFVVSYRKA